MKKVIFSLFFALIFIASQAQEAETAPEAPQNLNELYNQMKSSSNTWQNYRVINENKLDNFWATVRDSIRDVRQDLSQAQATINNQQENVDNLQSQLNQREETLEKSEYESSRISFLGIYILKDTYNKIVWGIILVLVVLLVIGFIRFRYNEKTARRKRKDFEDLNEEFEEYRKIVRKREIKIKRELQTERNKLEEMKHRSR
ncbi:MAG: hypothetical protein ACNS62_02165 [Candidatus Cyclobacteriaceae bacterium M3_2C_046]